MRTVLVPAGRVERWVRNFTERHGSTALSVADGALTGSADDGSTFRARQPFERQYAGAPDPNEFAEAARIPLLWGVLLVRRGGFAVATLHGDQVLAHKVGQRHVQGRTKAGGQSQQRFARRRANQARQAFEAAAEHAHRILVSEREPLDVLVCGGDRAAVDEVLRDPRLSVVAGLRVEPWLPVPDPRRSVLEKAIQDGSSCAISVADGA
jgi:hypothetical protein